MNSLLKINKTILTFAIIFLLCMPILGFKLIIGILGNVLLLLFLIPLLLLIIALLSFYNLNSKIISCSQCGSITLGNNDICMNCGGDLNKINLNNLKDVNPSETTIEVNAEEIN